MRTSLLALCTFLVMVLTSCGSNCPNAAGNFVDLDASFDFDTVYNDVLYLPSNKEHSIDTSFYDRSTRRCDHCLTIDIGSDSTTYVLRGNTRTDTIWLTYNVMLEYTDDVCEYQARPVNLQVSSTFSQETLQVLDASRNTWSLWVEL